MFVDRAVVTFIAGKGGDGGVSFRREKFIPKGGPDGGDGGEGGSIILTSNKNCHSLLDFKFTHIVRAEKGTNGSGAKKTGKHGKNIHLPVPPGTVVKSYPEEKPMFDFPEAGISITLVKGGKGGAGNVRFKSSINRAPRFARQGKPGETVKVILELKLIAFAGLVGFPNAGKSTLISKISGARPKIADYPFTTLTPHLGVVYRDYESLVVADIPGIIRGAHQGEGMGLNFLKHIERNKVLIFLLDASPYGGLTPLEAYQVLQEELKSYSAALLRKKRLVVVNKIDLLDPDPGGEARKKLEPLKEACRKQDLPYMEISALREINLGPFKNRLFELYHAA
jgi:GTP-binding protein